MLNWLFKLTSPKLFYEMTNRFLPKLTVATIFFFSIGLVWALAFAPPDYQQGHYFRIIYVHVPSALLMEGCYWMMALMSIGYLVWNIKMADMVAKSCAPIGAAATVLMLASGSIWGIPSWGTWWIWDARLTSSLVMLFIYIGIIALRSAYGSQDSGAKACAVLTLVGVVNIPIIKYSVDWWYTLHQSASDISFRDASVNPPEIWVPIFVMGFGFIAFFFLSVILRTRNEVLIRERKSQWVTEMISKEIS